MRSAVVLVERRGELRPMTRHVVMFSGGVGSWAAAKRVAEKYGTDNLHLLFTDTLMEDADLYRFLAEAAADVGGKFIRVAEGRDPWQVFHDKRFLGNTRIDPCSAILKRNMAMAWVREHCDPSNTVIYLGIDWMEIHRLERSKRFWAPWRVEAPMCEAPLIDKPDILKALEAEGIRQPRLYDMGFPHNNCGGFCIKAGQAHFKLLLEKIPERYGYHEMKEEELRRYLDKNIAILRDRTGGQTNPLTLKELRERVESGRKIDCDDWGGCGCFMDVELAGGREQ
ncbi:hypothetical protein LCGC14_0810950 [marine sediment metagenome]|uniref:Phosphoadenosine phosphosulphate reductase domain-containing protein n=1 Tax=marine sediment metagenome TaxID=412755 RepID=A0A0F9PR73_9ZZZZ